MRKLIPFLLVLAMILFCRVDGETAELKDVLPAIGVLALAALISVKTSKKDNNDNTPNIFPG